jgi:transcriptional regulator with XRE-family HTH domain
MKPSELIEQLVGHYGQKNLAFRIGIDETRLSRIRSGKGGGFSISQLDALFDLARAVVLTMDEYHRDQEMEAREKRQLEDALELMGRLWGREKQNNRQMRHTDWQSRKDER